MKKIVPTNNSIGNMYNISDRPTIKLNKFNEVDMLKFGRTENQRNSLIIFDS